MAKDRVNNGIELVVIGGSAGSLEVILQLLPALGNAFPLPLLLVLHRRHTDSQLAQLLGGKTGLTVKEAEEKEPVLPGHVYLAPADYHLLVEADRTLSLDFSEKVQYSRPSIDVTFESAAEVYGGGLAAVLLSGANADGTAGLLRVKAAGGITVIQDPADAIVGFMPRQAREAMRIDYVVKQPALAPLLASLAGTTPSVQ
jgi:two-component system chemotaxis response regulator CheB